MQAVVTAPKRSSQQEAGAQQPAKRVKQAAQQDQRSTTATAQPECSGQQEGAAQQPAKRAKQAAQQEQRSTARLPCLSGALLCASMAGSQGLATQHGCPRAA